MSPQLFLTTFHLAPSLGWISNLSTTWFMTKNLQIQLHSRQPQMMVNMGNIIPPKHHHVSIVMFAFSSKHGCTSISKGVVFISAWWQPLIAFNKGCCTLAATHFVRDDTAVSPCWTWACVQCPSQGHFCNTRLGQGAGLLLNRLPLIHSIHYRKVEEARSRTMQSDRRLRVISDLGNKHFSTGRWLLWIPYLCRTSCSRPLLSSIWRRSLTISCCTISSCLRPCCFFLVSSTRSLLFSSSMAPRRASLSLCCLCLSASCRALFSRTFSGNQ